MIYLALTMFISMYCMKHAYADILDDNSMMYVFLSFVFWGLEFIPLASPIRTQHLTSKMKNISLVVAGVLCLCSFVFSMQIIGLVEPEGLYDLCLGFVTGFFLGSGSIIVLCVLADEKVVEFINAVKENLK